MNKEFSELLQLTAETNNYNKIFIKVEHDFSLDLVNENKLNIYHLRTENRRFIYGDLTDYCVRNIVQYVFNRNVIRGAKTLGDIQILYNQAKNKFREINNDKDSGAGGELGELLLYLFLESELKAPKLLSKMEIKTTRNQYVYGADGVHLHFTKDGEGKPVYQFIIGESKIKNDILDATRVAFDSINNSLNEIDIEVGLVSGEILKEACTREEANIILQMILPSEDVSDKLAIHEKAVGVFIGYTGDYDEDIPNSKWNETVDEKIKKDISRAISTMKKKIEEYKLKGYSFYCYYLPFNNAEEDRKIILKSII